MINIQYIILTVSIQTYACSGYSLLIYSLTVSYEDEDTGSCNPIIDSCLQHTCSFNYTPVDDMLFLLLCKC